MRFLQSIAILLLTSLGWAQRGQVTNVEPGAVKIQLLSTTNPGGPAGNGCPNWVMANTILAATDNGLSRVVRTRPTAESKRIVIIGSSTARGLGASNCLTTSWAARFGTAMVAKGYTVYNVAHEGENSTSIINRFFTDVAPLLPDFVVIAGSISNDGGPTAGNLNFHQQSLARLTKMVESIEAIPVIMGQFPNNAYTVAQYQALQDLYNYEEKMGVQVFDFLSSTVDPTTGHFLSQIASADGTHPDDNGHLLMYQSIPQGYFDFAKTVRMSETPHNSFIWQWGSDTTTMPLKVTPFPSLGSFTASMWVKDNGGAGSAMWGSDRDTTNPLRIRANSTTGVYELADGGTTVVASTISATSKVWHHLAVSFNSLTNKATLYIDGALIGSGTLTRSGLNSSNFSFGGRYDTAGGNCVGCQFADPMIFRTSLQAPDVVALYSGNSLRKSLEFYSRFGAAPGTYAVNSADTGTQGTLGPTWTYVGKFSPPGDPYDVPFSIPGTPTASTNYPWITFTRAVTFPANWVGSQGSVTANPTAAKSFTVSQVRSGVTTQIATVAISTAGVVTFTTVGGTPVVTQIADRWIVGTPTADATLAGVAWTAVGSR
jgi:lysophospholipase L1-like esterase